MRCDELREIEADEAWLSGVHTPGPSAESVARTKALLRQELARHNRVWRFGPATGFWAAAAMLTLSAGLIWQARMRHESGLVAASVNPVSTALNVDADEAVLASLAGEVGEMDSSLAAQTPLERLLDDVEDLESESVALWDSSGA